MAKAAKKSGRKPKLSLTEAQIERLASFPFVRKRISDALERKPLSVDISGPKGRYVSFRIRDPRKFHPALFATMDVGDRGTLLRIGTPKSAVKKPQKLRAFLKRIGWNPKKKEWKRRPSDAKRRDTVYQLREGGVIGGSRIQSVLVPKKRVEEVAQEFLGRPQVRKIVGAAANPLLATLGINPPPKRKKPSSRRNVYRDPSAKKRILSHIRGLSDGTLAVITGTHNKKKLESIQQQFHEYVLQSKKKYRSWQDAWLDFWEPAKSANNGRKSRTSASRNPAKKKGIPTINIPFRDGQKVSVAKVRAWIKTLPAGAAKNAFSKRFEQCMKQYRRFNEGSEPKNFMYRTVPMGTAPGVTDLDFVVSEGKEWAAPYQVPKHSGKYRKDVDGRYIHAHGESELDIEIKKPVSRKKLPDRFHTADGKFIGVIPSRNVKISDWYRG